MQKYLFKDILLVNEGKTICTDLLVEGERIEKISANISTREKTHEIDGKGMYLLPGIIDDQVHFREPGLTHKGDIHSESRAAVAGGITSFMEMPNTIPNALTIDLLEDKYQIGASSSLCNYSFFMGVSNDNAEEVLKINKKKEEVCGVKIFMGSSTGNMLVDREDTLNRIFSESEMLIACHCEKEEIVRENHQRVLLSGKEITAADHPIIRDVEACYASSSFAISLAEKYNTRLHILHLTTAKETGLFRNDIPLAEKRITSEVCVHHLHFTSDDYERLGYLIKCNPAIKEPSNKEALWKALLDDRLDIIATDHAPHLLSEKQPPYDKAHAGLPLVQHSLPLMMMYYQKGYISMEKIVEKMCHAVADCFRIKERGYVREGYYADLCMVDPGLSHTVSKSNILYKCGWSPLEGTTFPAGISMTMVNGNIIYEKGRVNESFRGRRLTFNR